VAVTAATTSGTAALAGFAAAVDAEALPVPVRHEAARLLLDTVGCILGGHGTEAGRLATAWAAATGAGGRVAVLGTQHRLTAPLAAYANGRLAAVLDADETWPSARQTAHLAASTVATALATTEARDGSGADLLAAIVAGYEVGARISDALVPSSDSSGALRAGWGPGSHLGATAAAARGMALDQETAAQALGIAGTHADVPPLQWPTERPAPMAKSADAGWHALQAVAAAEMAAVGLTGYPRVLDGDDGLWRALGYAGWDEKALLGGLGQQWRILDAAFKRWPCQYWMHPPLTALWRLLTAHEPPPDAIRRIALETNPKSAGARFRDPAPPAEIDRAFSLPHAAAMLLLGITPGRRWLADDVAADIRVGRLRSVVEVTLHPDAGRLTDWVVDHGFRDLPARATAELADGRVLVGESRFGLGAPWSAETSLSDADLEAKARELADGAPGLDEAIAWIHDAASQPRVSDLTALLTPEAR
jgi:2-methylcitrate dehydratase PrpD